MSKKSNHQPKSFQETLRASLEHSSSRSVQLALLGVLLLSAISVFLINWFGGVEVFRNLIDGAGAFAPLVYIALKASTFVFAPLSGTPVKLAGGALFGVWEGSIYVLIGDVLGASLNFWIARFFRVKGVTKLAGKKALKQIDETTQHVGGWKALLIARLLLSSLYDFISYAAGLSNLKFKHFFWVTLLAGIPYTLLTVWLGDALVSNQKLTLILTAIGAVLIVATLLLTGRGNTPNRQS